MPANWNDLKYRAFDYRGYSYKPEIDDGDPAVVKLTHSICDPAGTVVGSIHDVYGWPTRADIEAKIDQIIGRPSHPMQSLFNEISGATL